MKIRSVKSNNRKHEFIVVTRAGDEYPFPYSEADPRPQPEDRIEEVFVDKELVNEAFTYVLESGAEGSIHIHQILEHNEEPEYPG